ncbi:unnamed protein product [Miscanthus lutarioriparius]|uniref:Cytochrome P450 n=1 Tax=Miscanthus lutarioriparius TaxID=422564 RepID=A0A811R2H3_9POAL|nr:unnamed protein product [Miscanthus lutarioriparius]
MEQVVNALCLFLVSLLLPVLLLKLNWHGGSAGQRLPPGPSRLPVIGSLHHLLFMRIPLAHRAMPELSRRHSAPLMYLRLGEVGLVVASSPAASQEIMRAHDVAFASRPWIPSLRPAMKRGAVGLVFGRYGALWRQLCRISVLELLSAKRVRSFRRVCEVAVAAATPGEAVNVGKRVAALTADATMRAVVGDRFEWREEFLRAIEEGSRLVSGFSLGDLFPTSRLASFFSRTAGQVTAVQGNTMELMDRAVRQHEERRRAATTVDDDDDVLDALLRIHKEGGLEVPLSMDIVKSLIIRRERHVSGHAGMGHVRADEEPRSNGESTGRGAQQAPREASGYGGRPTRPQIRYLKLVIKETLRLHPPLPLPLLLPRECMEDRKVMGYDMPKGTMVLVNAWAIGRDPEHWDDADAFKSERFEDGRRIDFKGTDFEFIPFGAGRRMCPGATFALATVELVLASLLYHFDWELPGGVMPGELDMDERMGMSVTRKNDLCLCPVVRVPPYV